MRKSTIKIFLGLLKRGHGCAKKVDYLPENVKIFRPLRSLDPIMKALASI